MLPPPCPDKTRHDLEWDRVLAALAARCATPMGKALARDLPFCGSYEEAADKLEQTRELVRFDDEGEPLRLGEVWDVQAGIDRARVGAALSNEELRGVAALLSVARSARRFIGSRRAKAPRVFDAFAFDATLDELERELASSFDPDGSLSDRASPRLEALRAERRASRERLVRRLDEFIKKHGDILQDAYWTERDGRYVLPVRSDSSERFPGIVHATSSSGATIFVEPRVLVESGNRQKMLDAQVAREEEAVYAALSLQVGERVESVAAAIRALAELDVRIAASRMAVDVKLAFPEVRPVEAGPAGLELRNARHVILALAGVEVVPSDLVVTAGRALVVSGPNAGGKTVALKTLGLTALMVRAGLPIAAGDGSRATVFEIVLTDVGDDQNLGKNLSTFSAHVQNLASILDATSPGALVLLDELAGGTDPREGEALAGAVLDSLCARGGAVACTTHYEGLKALALEGSRFDNASVGFELATMSPTFRLRLGVPGASSALAVAKRYGIPETVLERARGLLARDAATFDEMVERLAREEKALELARGDATREAEKFRGLQRELEAEIARMKDREERVVSRETEALLEAVRRAREDLRNAQAKLRGAKNDEAAVRAAAKAIDAVAHKTSVGGELEPPGHARRAGDDAHGPLAPGALHVGARVWVPKLRALADVVEIAANGQVRVAAGPLKITTTRDELRAAAAEKEDKLDKLDKHDKPEKGGRHGRAGVPFEAAGGPEAPIQTGENTVDLRGLRADEAVAMATQFLDRSLGANRRVAFLIHGHGSGALRDAVRDSLAASPYVERSRRGEPREGGDGVTVVWLR